MNSNKGNLALQVTAARPAVGKKGTARPRRADEPASGFDGLTAADAARAGQTQIPVGGAYKLLGGYPADRGATVPALQLSTNRAVEITLVPFAVIPGSEEVTGRHELWASRVWGIRAAIRGDNLEPLRDCGRCDVHKCHYFVTDAPGAIPLSRLPLPVPAAVAMSVLMGAAQALAELHAGGEPGRPVVHGGVGLDTILLASEPTRRVLLGGFANMTYAGEMRPDGTGPAHPSDDIRALACAMEKLMFGGPAVAGSRAPVRASLARVQRLLTEMQAPGAACPSAEQVLARLAPAAG